MASFKETIDHEGFTIKAWETTQGVFFRLEKDGKQLFQSPCYPGDYELKQAAITAVSKYQRK